MSNISNDINKINSKKTFTLPEVEACCDACRAQINQVSNSNQEKVKKQDASNEEGHEFTGLSLKIYLFRLLFSLVLMLLLMFSSFFEQILTNIFEITNENTKENTILALYIFAYVLAGFEVNYHALKNVLKGKFFDENFLMSIASLGAFYIGEWNEALGVMIFYGIGEYLQSLAVARSRRNIEELMDICPDIAHLKTLDGIKDVAPESVAVGDILIVRPGEKIPLDGEVIKGESFADTMALTGESVPMRIAEGSEVLSGSINMNSLIEVKVQKTFNNSTVAKILDLVQHAAAKKARSEKFITKFAKYYTPLVVMLAVLVAFVPPFFFEVPFENWLYRALTFLIISCPCALVLSIPIAFFGGIGASARAGILVKGGNYLETLNDIDTLVVDKTGTLTKGVFHVQKVHGIGISDEDLLQLAASAEAHSTHPIAKSILAANKKPVKECLSVTEIAGKGIIAQIGEEEKSDEIRIGNKHFLAEIGIENLESFTQTAVYIAKNNIYLGYILIADEVKENVKESLIEARKNGIKKIVMLTGDNKNIAQALAKDLGIDEVKADLLPHEKVYELEKIMQEKGQSKAKTAFVGDGINDAPVLSRADIGIAMGGIGSDAAIEAADVVLMNDELSKVAISLNIARKTRQVVIQNIIFALGVKAVVMILALYGITSIWFAIFADVGVALIAIANAMRVMLKDNSK